MAEQKQQMFEHLAEFQLIICTQCRCAIWPDQIEGHLTGKQHRVERKKAVSIAEEVRERPGIIQHPSELYVSASIEHSLDYLPLYNDGIRCKLQPEYCHFVGRGKESI